MTYLALYQEHVEDALAQGGTPAEMEALVAEYNAIDLLGAPPPGPRYRRWLAAAEFLCTACGRSFKLGPRLPQPKEEPECTACRLAEASS